MATSLLKTKLNVPPLRADLVLRPRLLARLDLVRTLTLVSAPAGFGKTTLVSEWAAGSGRPVAWLSLEPGDDDPARFWTYVIAALQTVQPSIGEASLGMLQTPHPPDIEIILTALLNEMSVLPDHTLLVLDDYHLIQARSIHEAMGFLLDHLPPSMQLVLLTRADPMLRLSRLRARNQLLEVRTADLRFTPEEVAAFLNGVMGLALASDGIAALEARTEGWIAGLQLAALSMQGRDDIAGFISAFTGSHHYIVDYLAEEVLGRQDEATQDLLLATSILERLTGPLCDVLTGRTDGQATLAGLEQANLFVVRLDDERRWYRYHHLFADLLRHRLRQLHPGRVPELHRRASAWFEQNGLIDEAIQQAFAADDTAGAVRLLAENWFQLLTTRSLATVLRWMEALPDDVVHAHPRLSLVYAHLLSSLGRGVQELEPYVLHAGRALTEWVSYNQISVLDPEYSALEAEISAFRSSIAAHRGDLDSAISLAKRALSLAPAESQWLRGYVYSSLGYAYRKTADIDQAILAYTQGFPAAREGKNPTNAAEAIWLLARLLRIQGQLRRAVEVVHEGLRYVEGSERAQLPIYGLIHMGMAEVLYEQDELVQAEQALKLGLELCERGDFLPAVLDGRVTLARLMRARGDRQSALDLLQEAALAARKAGIRATERTLAVHHARMQAEMGNSAEASAWIGAADLCVGDGLGPREGAQAIQVAHTLVALGRLDEAADLLSQIEAAARAGNSLGWLIEVLSLQAVIWQRRSDLTRALTLLERVVILAEPEGFIRSLVDQGQEMAVLLRCLCSTLAEGKRSTGRASDPRLRWYIDRLLRAFPDQGSLRSSQIQALIEPLSERELEVLRLLIAGKSNRDIAAELVIATGTVKKHLSNIFGKLNASNRTECAARARELHLV